MPTIGEILERKRLRGIVSVDPGATILEAVRRMDEANTGSIVVLDQERLVGIFTERDLMRRVVLKGLDLSRTVVSDVMTRDLVYTETSEEISSAMGKMTRHRCRHLPVVQGERLLGLVSVGDLMKEISEQQTVEIEFLKEYIYSR